MKKHYNYKSKVEMTDPDMINVEPALIRAAKRALEQGLKNNAPVYVMKDGKIVDLTEEYKNNKED